MGRSPISKYVVFAGWADVPHLSEEAKAGLLSAYQPHERDARTKGIPSLGAGAIYPVPEEDILCDPIEFPAWFEHAYALDVGWNRTAALWGARDPETDIVYLYAEYYRGQAEPAVHAAAIRSRGEWIPGVIDPAARGRGQRDGETLLNSYQDMGLRLTVANNAVHAGIDAVWQRLSTGRLKVFRHLQSFLGEYRIYRRDEKGRIVKENDHLMDCCLVGGTRVVTDRGLVPIADLVGTTGRVLTTGGAWATYCGARLTIRQAPTVRLRFDDGAVVRCTYDHPFLTPDGWKQAYEMAGCFCYNGVSQREAREALWSRLSSIPRFKSFWASGITCAGNIFAGLAETLASCCIGRSGPSITTGAAFPLGSTSITRTMTEQTTSARTWNYCLHPSTVRLTIWGTSEASRPKQSPLRHNGTDHQTARSGTSSTTTRSRTKCTSTALSSASNAVVSLWRRITAPIGSAPTIAKPSRARRLVWTMSNAIASSAAWSLWQIATSKPGHARERALARCLGVRDAGPADVYCLTVPGTSAFCVETGLTVHNTRYLVLSGVTLATIRPPEQWGGRPGSPPTWSGIHNSRIEADYDPYAAARQVGQQPASHHQRGTWMPGQLR